MTYNEVIDALWETVDVPLGLAVIYLIVIGFLCFMIGRTPCKKIKPQKDYAVVYESAGKQIAYSIFAGAPFVPNVDTHIYVGERKYVVDQIRYNILTHKIKVLIREI